MFRDNEDKHSLITRTEAKNDYLLKDCDLDSREPILKCMLRKNPHNSRWGSMKLYLHIQIEERALQVWGSQEAILNEKELRLEKKDVCKSKKYTKQLKELRMNVRSSLYVKTKKSHVHIYGSEDYDEDKDIYTHVCTICQYVEEFEKMWIKNKNCIWKICWPFQSKNIASNKYKNAWKKFLLPHLDFG